MKTRKTIKRDVLRGIDFAGWYVDGLAIIRRRFADPWRMAMLLASYSPRVAVRRAFNLARFHYDTGNRPPACLSRSWQAACRGLVLGHLSGPKTENFRQAILGRPDALVLDVWTCRGLGIDPEKNPYALKRYRPALARFADIAAELSLPIASVQAAQWAGVIRDHGRNPKPLIDPGWI